MSTLGHCAYCYRRVRYVDRRRGTKRCEVHARLIANPANLEPVRYHPLIELILAEDDR